MIFSLDSSVAMQEIIYSRFTKSIIFFNTSVLTFFTHKIMCGISVLATQSQLKFSRFQCMRIRK